MSLNILYINIRQQTGFKVEKQQEIEFWARKYRIDVIHLQECHILEDSFAECPFICNNFNIITNNSLTKYGTASLIKSDLDITNVNTDEEGRVIIMDIANHTQVNMYLPAGSDAASKNKREEYFSFTIPQLLTNKKDMGICGGDLNCVTHAIDC